MIRLLAFLLLCGCVGPQQYAAEQAGRREWIERCRANCGELRVVGLLMGTHGPQCICAFDGAQ